MFYDENKFEILIDEDFVTLIKYLGNEEIVEIPDGITKIEMWAFLNSKKLKNVIIPNSVVEIGSEAFCNCITLHDVVLPNSIKTLGFGLFSNCISLAKIEIPNTVMSIDNYCFSKCLSLYDISIPDSVMRIGKSAFEECSKLTNIDLPKNLGEIEEFVFSRCASLNEINLPSTIEIIQDGAFENCIGLNKIKLSNQIKRIGSAAFYNCIELSELLIPNSTLTIGEYAFFGCKCLTEVILPESVNVIGKLAFGDCFNLKLLRKIYDFIYESSNNLNFSIKDLNASYIITFPNQNNPNQLLEIPLSVYVPLAGKNIDQLCNYLDLLYKEASIENSIKDTKLMIAFFRIRSEKNLTNDLRKKYLKHLRNNVLNLTKYSLVLEGSEAINLLYKHKIIDIKNIDRVLDEFLSNDDFEINSILTNIKTTLTKDINRKKEFFI